MVGIEELPIAPYKRTPAETRALFKRRIKSVKHETVQAKKIAKMFQDDPEFRDQAEEILRLTPGDEWSDALIRVTCRRAMSIAALEEEKAIVENNPLWGRF